MPASTFGSAQSVTPSSRPGRASVAYSAPTARQNVHRGNGKRALPNKRLKLAARVDLGMNLSLARRSLSAVR